jgi:uncharacterized protein (DUF427 family)
VSQALDDQTSVIAPRPRRRIVFEDSPRWVRTVFADTVIADSKRMKLLLEGRSIAVYYFPIEDVRRDLLIQSGFGRRSRTKGDATYFSVRVGDRVAEDACWRYENPPAELAELSGYMAFDWNKMDAWFEEDDEVFVHARHPYHRVDVLNSSRHVRIELDGAVVAETTRPRLLFETGLPTRYYIPKLDVRVDLLEPSDRSTACPYKGTAVYWSARVNGKDFKDIVWSYPTPIPECPKIENLLAFFNERADIYVDGELQEKPNTVWSKFDQSR